MYKGRSARSPRLRLEVTEEIIEMTIPKDSNHCMIAEAVKRAYPEARGVSVDLATIRFTDRKKGFRYTYLTPRIAQSALVNFDQGRKAEPFSFTLRGAQVTTSGSRQKAAGDKEGEQKRIEQNTEGRQQAMAKARLVYRKKEGHVPERVGGKTPPLQKGSDNLPFSRRRAFGLRALEL